MDEKFHVAVTSRDSAEVDDIALTPDREDKGTRRIIRPMIVNNAQEAAASVQLELIHQKRHKKNEPWEDAEKFNMATLKAGQEVRFDLDATETWRLKETLNQLYAMGKNGVPRQSTDFVAIPAHQIADSLIVKGDARQALETLHDEYGDDLWRALDELHPHRLESMAIQRLHTQRQRAIDTFRNALEAGKGKEEQWQKFFADNLWIFGYGLDFRILNASQEHPHPAGMVTGFTVLVDVKTPQTLLVEAEPHQESVHVVNSDVTTGIAQLQLHCRSWVKPNSRQEGTNDLIEADVYHREPKAILIIGSTAQLDTKHKRTSFEMFRRNLHTPEIITFDELLARAEFLIANTKHP